MKVEKVTDGLTGESFFRLLDHGGEPVREVDGFLRFLRARGDSPNTLEAYAYDLRHFYLFLAEQDAGLGDFTPALSLRLLEHLRRTRSRNRVARRLAPALVVGDGGPDGRAATGLAPATANRVLACVSSFYDHLVLSGHPSVLANPMVKEHDTARARVPGRSKPFLAGISRSRPVRRAVRVRGVLRVPRPMDDGQVRMLLGSLKKLRDRAMVLLMLQGGLRPGEVLNLKLEDVQYGRRRVVVRHREDHPKGVRTKSRTERVVDLHEPEALDAVSAYVMRERPADATSGFVFLVGGKGKRRLEPLSYWALVKLFERRCDELGIRAPWVTPHALRHTHATKMWDGGMRELALQKRLGHASPESTGIYTRVTDAQTAEEYRRAMNDAASEEGRADGGHR